MSLSVLVLFELESRVLRLTMILSCVILYNMKNNDRLHDRLPISKKLGIVMALSSLALASDGASPEVSASVRPQAQAVRAEKSQKNETPFHVLTGLVAALDRGDEVRVAAREIKIPGPISEAKGSPIVFKANGQEYLAYTQEQRPNFNQKRPADVAGDMAIVKEPTADAHMPLEYAHLDKADILVNEDEMPVGYSTGGETTGK